MRLDLVVVVSDALLNFLVMEKKNIYTLTALAILTIVTASLSNNSDAIKYVAILILLFSAMKFILVAFQFMELKKANNLWKTLLVMLLFIFVGAVSLIVS